MIAAAPALRYQFASRSGVAPILWMARSEPPSSRLAGYGLNCEFTLSAMSRHSVLHLNCAPIGHKTPVKLANLLTLAYARIIMGGTLGGE